MKALVLRRLPANLLEALLVFCLVSPFTCSLLAGTVKSDFRPAVVVWPDGHANWFVVDQSYTLYCYDGTVWHAISPPSSAFSDPAVVLRSSGGEMDIAVQGQSGSLDYYYGTDCGHNWTKYRVAESHIFSAPAMVVRSTGEADIVAITDAGQLMYYWGWSPTHWYKYDIQPAGGLTIDTTPAIVVNKSGLVEIAVADDSKGLVFYAATPGSAWSGPARFKNPLWVGDDPGSNYQGVAYVGIDHMLVHWGTTYLYEFSLEHPPYWDGTWIIGPGRNPASLSAPTVAVRPDGDIDLAELCITDFSDTDPGFSFGVVYFHRQSSKWSNSQILRIPSAEVQITTSSPTIVTPVKPTIAVDPQGKWLHVVFPDPMIMDCVANPDPPFSCRYLN